MSDPLDPYYKWLAIPPAEQPPTHYRLLGVSLYETDLDVISNAADQRMAHVRSFQSGPYASVSQRILNEISAARVTLLNPSRRAAYDAALAAQMNLELLATPPTEVAVVSLPAPVLRPVNRRQRRPSNPALGAVKIVVGGMFGLFFAVLILSYFTGLDLLGLQRKQDDRAVAISTETDLPKTVTARGSDRHVSTPSNNSAQRQAPSLTPMPAPVVVAPPPTVGFEASPSNSNDAAIPSSPPSASPQPAATSPLSSVRNSIGMEFRPIEPGTFSMGLLDIPEFGPHLITLTQPFHIGVHEVNQQQYELVMGSNPSLFRGPNRPVEKVSWLDAVEFCQKLSRLPEEQAAGRQYRLPTEAEWEYACRAGTTTKYSCGDDYMQLDPYGWFEQNSQNETRPVGLKKPNPWGLCDMYGNVREWCHDWYDANYYARSPARDPRGPHSGIDRVNRGGAYDDAQGSSPSAMRASAPPDYRQPTVGLRVVFTLDTQ